ncbi:MAG: MCE family protein [Muribaculaceae bacterium]|nr:MCE family protein [Muribaculaceae bacterium]
MKKNILIAVCVIASLCLLYWGIEFLKGVNMFKPANFYYAKFEKVDGLVEAAPVSINGFPVGQVREIRYDYATNQISVMLAMNRDLKIPVGSQVSVVSSLTGASTLALTLGESTEYYKVGDEIQGVVPAGLMDKVNTEIMPQVAGILPKVDSIMGNVNGIVGDPALRMSIARLDAITQQLVQSSQQLTTLMHGLNQSVPGVMNNVDGITANLTGASDNINTMTGNLKALPIDSTLNEVNATIANIKTLTTQLNDPNSSLGLLLNDRELYNNATKTLADLDSLFIDIKKNPKRYINIKLL